MASISLRLSIGCDGGESSNGGKIDVWGCSNVEANLFRPNYVGLLYFPCKFSWLRSPIELSMGCNVRESANGGKIDVWVDQLWKIRLFAEGVVTSKQIYSGNYVGLLYFPCNFHGFDLPQSFYWLRWQRKFKWWKNRCLGAPTRENKALVGVINVEKVRCYWVGEIA
ncbi:hypothetical protein CEXT_510251 [Caerostris extrusa]|uniref:Uncharacterized protein n=1 Tax=Caerostris extrusa TaxID=172846 RepID=A0AAV4QXD1_CAEEX|nr:hypothetical protein CEXT_510251 [Caerostris extrusa]